MPQIDAKSISIKLVSHLDSILNLCLKPLRRHISDIEVFDGVFSQYFSGLNSLDILVQPPVESDSFQVLRCRKYCEQFLFLDAVYIQIPLWHKAIPLPSACKIQYNFNFSKTRLFLRVIITIPFKSFT